LNVGKLEDYEAYLRNRGNQDSGIAFKMRAVRAVYNSAIRNGIVKQDFYPFDKYKISKLKGKGIKRALNREEVKRILDVDLTDRPDLINDKSLFWIIGSVPSTEVTAFNTNRKVPTEVTLYQP
jgi:site-specific recombinase XerD